MKKPAKKAAKVQASKKAPKKPAKKAATQTPRTVQYLLAPQTGAKVPGGRLFRCPRCNALHVAVSSPQAPGKPLSFPFTCKVPGCSYTTGLTLVPVTTPLRRKGDV